MVPVTVASFLLLGILQCLNAEFSTPCHQQIDGYYSNFSTSCQTYYKCRSHLLTESHTCPPGQLFSSIVKQCQRSSEVACIEVHCSNDKGFYAIPGTQCKGYYQCHQGFRQDLVCPDGSVFNFDHQSCVRTGGVCYEPVCTGRVNGNYADTTQKCKRAYKCAAGVLTAALSCPEGRLFNGQSCEPEYKVKCASPDTTAIAFPIPSTDRCATLSDGSHPAPDAKCRDYIICKDGVTQGSLRCPAGYRYDGHRCSLAELTPCKDECEKLPDGYHTDITSNCREYFYCQDHLSVSRETCPDSSVFNGYMCVPPPIYTCPSIRKANPCYKKADGFHRNHEGCTGYYYCSSGQTVLKGQCSNNENFNGSSCVPESEFFCEGPELYSGCQLVDEGYYQDRSASSSCSKYYYCNNGNRTKFSCRYGFVFDGENCVPGESYTCPSLETDSCDLKQDGYYAETSTSGCKSYYQCSNGRKSTYVCSEGHIFNGQQCVKNSEYLCPYMSLDCLGKVKGYYPDLSSKCRKYYYCVNNDRVTTLTCSGSKIYNGEKCVKPSEYVCPPENIPADKLCSTFSNGYYPDISSGCSKYFRCFNNKLVAQYSCSSGQIYDGRNSCIPKNCTSVVRNCDSDGFFTDFDTNCRSYFFCINGKKTVLTCPSNKVFNGEICVDESTFPCQTECDVKRIRNGCDNNI